MVRGASNRREAERLYELQDERLARQAERSLMAFVRLAWPVLEPRTPFLDNWHLHLMAEYLELVAAGEIRRLVINLPPRYMKSLMVSVLWPIWVWATRPETRWLFASYSDQLAGKHSVDRRRLLQSDWYRAQWGHRVRLHPDHNLKTEFQNQQQGVMVATSMGGTVTGKGGDLVVIDDPHSPGQALSDALRQQGVDAFAHTFSTRLDNKRDGGIVIVMQRVHHRDLSAHCLDLGYTHLCLEGVAETQKTIIFPRSKRELVREPGDVLWPTREGSEQLDEHRRTLGAHGFETQYQQRPVPRTGRLFKRDQWAFYDTLPKLDYVAQSWDMTFKGTDGSDYVVGLVGGRLEADYYLIDLRRGRWSFPETCRQVEQLAAHYPQARPILIEDAANGPAILDTLRHRVSGLEAVAAQDSKTARAHAVHPLVEAGNVHLPNPFDAVTGRLIPGRAWVEAFIEELAAFPQGAHDDQVDACTQLLHYLQAKGQDDWFMVVLRQVKLDHEEVTCPACHQTSYHYYWARQGQCPNCTKPAASPGVLR